MSDREGLRALPYYPWLWQDWRANRRIQRMSWEARGLYRELLDELWAEGFIPSEIEKLADICGCSIDVMERFWPEIAPCWDRVGEGFVNRKMEEQRTAKDAERARRALAGRLGGLACNSRTRAEDAEALAKRMQAPAEQVQASPDIGEDSREEESRGAPEAPPAPQTEGHTAEATEATADGGNKGDHSKGKVQLPSYVPATEWAEWQRVKRGAKTPYAQGLAINKLTAFHAQGYDIAAVLNYSIEGAHPSVYVNERTPRRKIVFEEVDPATFWEGSGLNASV